ncbi:MAG: DNA-binding GntR family transcriptional regulator [Paracoccaceae bacterium]|jgi:DNA-binding GntR family transcriptional regulator
MTQPPNKVPAHEMIYRRIRDKILFGDLAPGQAVTIQGMVSEFDVSMTPVREAIRRLTAEGALEFLGNRRITVPVITQARFAEICFARLKIEPKLAEMATNRAQKPEIDRLRRIDDEVNAAIDQGDVKAYMIGNHRFHFELYGLAGSNILMPIAETLWLRFGPLYRIISGKYGTQNLSDHHDEAIHALRAGDATAVAHAISQDIQQGFDIVRENFNWQ